MKVFKIILSMVAIAAAIPSLAQRADSYGQNNGDKEIAVAYRVRSVTTPSQPDAEFVQSKRIQYGMQVLKGELSQKEADSMMDLISRETGVLSSSFTISLLVHKERTLVFRREWESTGWMYATDKYLVKFGWRGGSSVELYKPEMSIYYETYGDIPVLPSGLPGYSFLRKVPANDSQSDDLFKCTLADGAEVPAKVVTKGPRIADINVDKLEHWTFGKYYDNDPFPGAIRCITNYQEAKSPMRIIKYERIPVHRDSRELNSLIQSYPVEVTDYRHNPPTTFRLYKGEDILEASKRGVAPVGRVSHAVPLATTSASKSVWLPASLLALVAFIAVLITRLKRLNKFF